MDSNHSPILIVRLFVTQCASNRCLCQRFLANFPSSRRLLRKKSPICFQRSSLSSSTVVQLELRTTWYYLPPSPPTTRTVTVRACSASPRWATKQCSTPMSMWVICRTFWNYFDIHSRMLSPYSVTTATPTSPSPTSLPFLLLAGQATASIFQYRIFYRSMIPFSSRWMRSWRSCGHSWLPQGLLIRLPCMQRRKMWLVGVLLLICLAVTTNFEIFSITSTQLISTLTILVLLKTA